MVYDILLLSQFARPSSIFLPQSSGMRRHVVSRVKRNLVVSLFAVRPIALCEEKPFVQFNERFYRFFSWNIRGPINVGAGNVKWPPPSRLVINRPCDAVVSIVRIAWSVNDNCI